MSQSPADRHVFDFPAEAQDANRTGKLALGALSILTLLVVVYWPVLAHGQFLSVDDFKVTGNRLVTSRHGLADAWFNPKAPEYSPLAFSLLWCEWRLWGANPVWFHFISVLLQALSAVLLWRILRRLGIPAAIWAALLFAVHPVNVESVAWIAQQPAAWSLVFWLASVYCFLRFDAERGRWLHLSLLAFCMALLSSGTGLALPVVLLACLWWKHGRISRSDAFRMLPFFAVAIALGTIRFWYQSHHGSQQGMGSDRLAAGSAALAGRAIWFYLEKAVFPIGLSFVYPSEDTHGPPPGWFLWWVALGVALGMFWGFRRRWGRPAIFASVCFFCGLLPVLGLGNVPPYRYSLLADHQLYFSLGAVCASLAGGLVIGLQRLKLLEGTRLWKVFVPVVVVTCGLSFHRVKSFTTPELLWGDVLAKNASAWMACNQLGMLAMQRGMLLEAASHFEHATEINAADAEAWENWGSVLNRQRQTAAAVAKYEMALRLQPESLKAHLGLAGIYLSQDRHPEAIRHLRAAAAAAPDDPSIRFRFGKALLQEGRDPEAVRELEEAVRIAPSDASIHNLLGFALSKTGRFQEAERHLSLAAQDETEQSSAYQNLGTLDLARGEVVSAIGHFRKALERNPKLMGARMNLAWLYSTEADPDQRNAKEALRISLELAQETRFRNPQVLSILSAAYAETGVFTQAVETARMAIALCATNNLGPLKRDLERHLDLYLSGQPVREQRRNQAASPTSR